jgi:hypothetical protein
MQLSKMTKKYFIKNEQFTLQDGVMYNYILKIVPCQNMMTHIHCRNITLLGY